MNLNNDVKVSYDNAGTKLKLLFFSVTFSLLMVSIDWESYQLIGIGGSKFIDKKQYLDYFTYGENVIAYSKLDSISDYVSNEYLWHFGVSYLNKSLNIPLENIFLTISFFCLFIFSFYIFKYTHPAAVLLLINPIIITFVFSQFRSALAVSILLSVIATKRYFIIFLGMLLAPFIHTVSVLIIAMFFASNIGYFLYSKHVVGYKLLAFYLFMIGFFCSLITGPLRKVILGYLGDRRAEYSDSSSSLLYSLFWVFAFLVFLVQDRRFFSKLINAYAFIVLSIAATSPLTGSYTTRFIAMFFPLIIISMLDLKDNHRLLVVGLYIAYSLLQWIYWLRLGW